MASFHIPQFDMKKILNDAQGTFSRVVQLTEEKFGSAEKTEFDLHFENLAKRADNTKVWTEKILKHTDNYLATNNRVEDFILDKIDIKKPVRLSNLEYLGLDMMGAGADFGQDYGQNLIKVGQAEQKLGICEREFSASAHASFIQPLRKFLDVEMKTITKEKGILENKRIDLDSCKNRVRKARSMIGQADRQQTKDSLSPEAVLEQAERDLRMAQAEFDRQAEMTKILLEGIGLAQESQLKQLHSFVEAQVRFFGQCVTIMNGLQRELSCLEGPTVYNPIGLHVEEIKETSNEGKQSEMVRYRVLCSYDAKDHTELSLCANEVLFVTECSPVHPDYMYGKQGLQKGLVPRAFLEKLDDNE